MVLNSNLHSLYQAQVCENALYKFTFDTDIDIDYKTTKQDCTNINKTNNKS